jgi:hypothetical protein
MDGDRVDDPRQCCAVWGCVRPDRWNLPPVQTLCRVAYFDKNQSHYPSGAVVTYAPGAAGLTLSTVDSGSGINYVTGATYGPDSALTSFISGNTGTFAGITNAFSYNKRLQPVAMSANAPSQTVFSIGYDFHLGNGTSGIHGDVATKTVTRPK